MLCPLSTWAARVDSGAVPVCHRRYVAAGMLDLDRGYAVPALAVYLVLLFLRPLPLLLVIARRRNIFGAKAAPPPAEEEGSPAGAGLEGVGAAAATTAEPRTMLTHRHK
jgi:hypothetical protein